MSEKFPGTLIYMPVSFPYDLITKQIEDFVYIPSKPVEINKSK